MNTTPYPPTCGLVESYSACRCSEPPRGVSCADWEDAVQTAALEFLLRPPRTWSPHLLYIRAKSRMVDDWRRRKDVVSLHPSMALAVKGDEVREHTMGAIELLPKSMSLVLQAWMESGRSAKQAAQLLGISPVAMRKRLQRCRILLRQCGKDDSRGERET